MKPDRTACAYELIIPFPLPLPPEQTAASTATQSSSLPVFLQQLPDRAYVTILTTHERSGIPGLDAQAARLLHSGEVLFGRSVLPSHESLRAALHHCVSILCATVPHDRPECPEVRLVAVLDDTAIRVHAHSARPIQPPLVHSPSVAVQLRGSPRSQPAVKNTRWVTDRRPLERGRDAGFAETVLSRRGCLYEGLISNFFVVSEDGTVVTAPDAVVYPGTMRSFVIQACQKLDVPVVFSPPDCRNWSTFRAAFVTNAAQMLVPVSSIALQERPDESFPDDFPNPLVLGKDASSTLLVSRLRECVHGIIELSLSTVESRCWR